MDVQIVHCTLYNAAHRCEDRGMGGAATQRGQCILFSVVYNTAPPSHHGSLWVLPVISLLLTITLYRRYGLAYPYDGRGFVGPKKKTIVGLLVLNHRLWSYLSCVQLYSWLKPRNNPPPPPPHLGSYTRALLVSQDRRHLFVAPCIQSSLVLPK